jgi:hypothetical protein
MCKLAEALNQDAETVKPCEKTEKHMVEMVESTLHLSIKEKDSFVSSCSEMSMEFNRTKNMISQAESPESLEKFFYSQCIKKKMRLSPSHPGKNLSIFFLYQDCVAKKIPVSEWARFITRAFECQLNIIT